MQHFLVIYDRQKGKILKHCGYRHAEAALRARFAAEQEFRDNESIEVVVLGAESWEALSETHARYFKDVQELAKSGLLRATETAE